MLEKSAGGVGDLLKRQIAKITGNVCPVAYSPEHKSFALTLHVYSPHAYRYVRKMFDTCLPHPRTIEIEFGAVNCILSELILFDFLTITIIYQAQCSNCWGYMGVRPPLLLLTPTSLSEPHWTPHFPAPGIYKFLGTDCRTPHFFWDNSSTDQ